MSMKITLEINGRVLDIIKVTNRGPVGGVFEPGDSPGGEGEREYEWASINGKSGVLTHPRRDGAAKLASRVLAAMESRHG